MIITDDCSSDNSAGVIESFIKKDDRIRLYTLKSNQGSGAARNHSIKMAKGRYIAFCDSDDQWKVNKLELQLNLMIKNNIVLSYSGYDVIGENGKFIKTIYPPKIITLKKILSNNYIGCLTAIYDSEKIGKQYIIHEFVNIFLHYKPLFFENLQATAAVMKAPPPSQTPTCCSSSSTQTPICMRKPHIRR